MAQLQVSSLIDCFYVPDFIASGTVMMFESTSAPTSWTKSTTHNNKSLRVVNGTISTGGSREWPVVLLSGHTLGNTTISAVQTGYQITAETANISVGTVTPPVTFSGSTTAAGNHNHSYTGNAGVQRGRNAPQTPRSTGNNVLAGGTAAGGGGQHTHSLSGNPHTHGVTSPHSHTISESPHSHGVTYPSQNFEVYYRDIILATKD